MRRPFYALLLLLATLLASCEVKMPEEIVSPDKMESLLYDYHLAQSMSSEYTSLEYKEKLVFSYVFSKHGVTQEQFENSMEWYNRYPKHLQKIYANLEKRLEEEVEKMNDAGGVLEDNVSLESLALDADTVDLWTGARNRMLACSMLDSYMSFSFDTPGDSTFIAGDSIAFSFDALFVTAAIPEIRQTAFAALSLKYEDGTTVGRGVEVRRTGEYVVTTDRNQDAALKSVSGFVYYFDTDTTAAAKLILNNISLKRMRQAKK